MLLVAYALLLGFGRDRRAVMAIAATVVATAMVAASVATAQPWMPAACWLLALAVAVVIMFGKVPPWPVLLLLAVPVGAVAGSALAREPASTSALAAAAVLLFVPVQMAVQRGFAIAPRVVAGWLAAVALLALVLPLAVAHPGYVADHRG